MSSFDILEQRAIGGDNSAIEELIKIARTTFNDGDIQSNSSSLRELLDKLKTQNRRLQEEDRELANNIVLDLADNSRFLSPMLFEYSQTPKMMNRILLFDNNLIEIRAHIFLEDAEETYIHNHGQPFISTCLQGSYLHKIWSVVDEENSMYYTHSRKPGGVYGDFISCEGGDLQKILCQPFSEGQSLFISTKANHTVSDLHGDVVTIVLRDKIKDLAECTILTKGPTLNGPSDSTVEVNDSSLKQKIFNDLCGALRNFKKSLLLQPLKDHYEIKENLDNIANFTNKLVNSEAMRKLEEYRRIASVVCIVAYWVKKSVLTPALRTRLKAVLFKLIGTRNIPASENELVELVLNSLTGKLLLVFKHIMYGVSLYEEGFDENVQQELMEVLQFPVINKNDNIFDRFNKSSDWIHDILNNPSFLV